MLYFGCAILTVGAILGYLENFQTKAPVGLFVVGVVFIGLSFIPGAQ